MCNTIVIKLKKVVPMPEFKGYTYVACGRRPISSEEWFCRYDPMFGWSTGLTHGDSFMEEYGSDNVAIFIKTPKKMRVTYTETGEFRTPKKGEWYRAGKQALKNSTTEYVCANLNFVNTLSNFRFIATRSEEWV